MPQPLSRVLPKASFSYGSETAQNRPEQAAMVFRCIANISQAENSKGLILSCMLGQDLKVGLAMYMAIQNFKVQDDVLRSAAQASLDEAELQVLNAIRKQTKAAFNERHRFAHSLWGYSNDLPDALLMIPSDKFVFDYGDDIEQRSRIPSIDRSEVQVYRNADLVVAINRSEEAAYLHHQLYMHLDWKRRAPHRQALLPAQRKDGGALEMLDHFNRATFQKLQERLGCT